MEDKDTRYFLDINLESKSISNYGYDQKDQLSVKLEDDKLHRIFLTKGQYHKLMKDLQKYIV